MFHRFIGFGTSGHEAAEVEYEIHDGDQLQVAGSLTAIHVPGYCAGQLAFLWDKHGGVLFAANTASSMMGLGYHLRYQDFEESKRTLGMRATLDFNVACFSHGEPIP